MRIHVTAVSLICSSRSYSFLKLGELNDAVAAASLHHTLDDILHRSKTRTRQAEVDHVASMAAIDASRSGAPEIGEERGSQKEE